RKKEGIERLLDAALEQRTKNKEQRAEDPDLSRIESLGLVTHTSQLAMSVGEGAVDILNNVLLPAMKDVGDKFGAGELILPFVLKSGEVMKRAVAHLEQFLDKQEGVSKGKVVLATVYGDVHDIGKSLVNTILSNNGYTVYDLGKQVPIDTIISKAQEVEA